MALYNRNKKRNELGIHVGHRTPIPGTGLHSLLKGPTRAWTTMRSAPASIPGAGHAHRQPGQPCLERQIDALRRPQPVVGDVIDGHRLRGGDSSIAANWSRIEVHREAPPKQQRRRVGARGVMDNYVVALHAKFTLARRRHKQRSRRLPPGFLPALEAVNGRLLPMTKRELRAFERQIARVKLQDERRRERGCPYP